MYLKKKQRMIHNSKHTFDGVAVRLFIRASTKIISFANMKFIV